MYKRILLAVDLNDEWSWRHALPVAEQLTRTFSAELELISVIPDVGNAWVGSFFPKGFELKLLQQHEQRLQQFVADHVATELTASSHPAEGRVHEAILRRASQWQADLIVMASHNPSLGHSLMGPNTNRVVDRSHCSVMVVRQPDPA